MSRARDILARLWQFVSSVCALRTPEELALIAARRKTAMTDGDWAEKYFPSEPSRSVALTIRAVFREQLDLPEVFPIDRLPEICQYASVDELLSEIEEELGISMPRTEKFLRDLSFRRIVEEACNCSPLTNSHTTTDVDSETDVGAGGDETGSARPPGRR